jgi:hypothetical protein
MSVVLSRGQQPNSKVDKSFWKNGIRAISSIPRIQVTPCQPTARRKGALGPWVGFERGKYNLR